jgi:hypothetical protein
MVLLLTIGCRRYEEGMFEEVGEVSLAPAGGKKVPSYLQVQHEAIAHKVVPRCVSATLSHLHSSTVFLSHFTAFRMTASWRVLGRGGQRRSSSSLLAAVTPGLCARARCCCPFFICTAPLAKCVIKFTTLS